MLQRLHYAGFTQNSFSARNVLYQAGPLALPPSQRSLKTPSFRIIDFGRGVCDYHGEEVASDADHRTGPNSPEEKEEQTARTLFGLSHHP